MRHVIRIIFCIPLFFFGGVCIFLGLFPVAIVFIGIGLFIISITMEKEKRIRVQNKVKEQIKDYGEAASGWVKVGGTGLKEVCKVGGEVVVICVKGAASFVEGAYNEAGGTPGCQKAVKKLGKGLEETGKIFTTAILETGNAVSEIAKDAQKQVNENRKNKKKRKKIEERETKQLEDVVVDFIRNLD